ncbi:hypothetical protein PVIIG_06171 [Plasmodium vivax India VII]|nr:hypothetical protein PVIIG_06171 [Plasmodium vivax India VII]
MNVESPELKNYEQKCKEIRVQKHEDEMKLICKKYLRFLDTSKAWSGLFYEYDISLLLNYWLYDKITHIYDTTQSEVIGIAFAALQRVWDLFPYKPKYDPYYKKCHPDPNKVNQEDWKNRKKLYDYYVDYNYLSIMAKSYDYDECKYYKQIKGKKSLYDHFAPLCVSVDGDCPVFYEKCRDYNPNIVLPTLPCHTKMEQANTSPPGDTKESSSHHPSGEADSIPGPGGIGGSEGSEAASHTQLGVNSDIRTKVTNSVLGAAPVLLTATALYRYTPFGSWIRKFRGGNTNSLGAIDMVPNYVQETGDVFSDHEANYISYQPM